MKIVGKLKKSEYLLWLFSALAIVVSFFLSGGGEILSLFSGLVGVSALIFIAKGYPICHILFVCFSILYAIISFKLNYFGEMITYICMSMPASIFCFISWLRHPYKSTAEVEIRKITKKDVLLTIVLTVIVTVAFYFILKVLGTANLLVSTLSVATSFLASFLSFLRSPYFALGYVFNDVVLVVLWFIATISDISYLSVTTCFAVFLINDVHGFISWKRMQKRQIQ